MTLDLVVHDAAQVVRVDEDVCVIKNGAVAVVDGTVAAVGTTEDVTTKYPTENAETAIDAAGTVVIPGFVDAHTHGLFAGDRSDEFEMKLAGKTYQEILQAGGGILRTVEATREASADELLAGLLRHLDTMLAHGTTTVEIKSGYGLDTETELKMLDVIAQADAEHPADIIPTFMGAHAVPANTSADDYVSRVVDDQIPAVKRQGLAEFCDVFCEEGVFTVDQSREVLQAGNAAGMTPKVHAEELTRLGGAQLASELGAASADHLLHANEEDVTAMKDAGVVPVLLPGTAFTLDSAFADARMMLEKGLPVAVATDFNPNCYMHSMQFAMTLSATGMRMTPAECLRAATRNGAQAVNREEGGRLVEGAAADLVVLEAPHHRYLSYSMDVNLVSHVVKDGEVVYNA